MLRLGTLPIRCNTGRYEKLLYNERLCTLCSLNEVQDEYHLCIKCPSFDRIRKMYLPHWVTHCSRYSFTKMLQTQNENIMFKLGLYLCKTKHMLV